jgi:hypothetical protein
MAKLQKYDRQIHTNVGGEFVKTDEPKNPNSFNWRACWR